MILTTDGYQALVTLLESIQYDASLALVLQAPDEKNNTLQQAQALRSIHAQASAGLRDMKCFVLMEETP